jgi:hypothetical protein
MGVAFNPLTGNLENKSKVAIGVPVSGGTSTWILYIDDNGKLKGNALLVWNDGNQILTAASVKVPAFLSFGSAGASGIYDDDTNLVLDPQFDSSHNLHIKTGVVGIGVAPNTSYKVLVQQSSLGSAVHALASTASNDDPIEVVYQNKITTTDSTVTTIHIVAIPTSTTVLIEAKIIARRTGGSSGSAEDSAAYVILSTYKNVAGTATEINETAAYTAEDQIGWNATITPSSGNALIQVSGATNNDISWVATIRVYTISS